MLAHPIYLMGVLIFALLCVSSIGLFLLVRFRPEKDFSELTDRIKAWWIMASIFFAAILVDEVISLFFFGFLSFWALKEYITLLKKRRADHGALVLAFLSIPVQFYLVHIGWYGLFIVFIPVYVFLLIPARMVITQEPKGFISSTAQIHWGLMMFVFGISHLAFLNKLQLVESVDPTVSGKTLILFLVVVTEMNDVAQYVWGKIFGANPIIPGISPNKTWEGFCGGVVTVSLLGMGLFFLTPFSLQVTAAVCAGLAVLGFFGDIVMSAVKRDFGIEDFGETIPGHGGMLDRLDSLCYTVPIFFHFVRYFYS